MKINLRLLLITFSVVVIISLSSTFIYYSTTTSLLKKQYSNNLINSAHDFSFELQSGIRKIEDEFERTIKFSSDINSVSVDTTLFDFAFLLNDNSAIDPTKFIHSSRILPPAFISSVKDFIEVYPNIILLHSKNAKDQNVYYGILITEEYLTQISQKIRAEVAFVVKDIPNQITNSKLNEQYLVNYVNAVNVFNTQRNLKVYYEELVSSDFFASIYRPKNLNVADFPASFLIFNTPSELSEFRDTMKMIMLIFTLAGILLSLIFILLFTTKIRKQISLLSKTTKLIAEGDLGQRVPIITKDELGQLGEAFNDMLDRLEIKEKTEKKYLDIVTIINEHPSLHELADNLLEKLINSTQTTFGAFYMAAEKDLELISTYGIGENKLDSAVEPTLYANVIQKQESVEMIFEKDFPSVKTGLLEIHIKYFLVFPIVFDKKVIAVIEVASENLPAENPKIYFDSIKEQLAVGVNNAASLEQLKRIVEELKVLNEQYSEQNSELVRLHADLKAKAEELEEQRRKAVELTHVKSQFLANMSHELRTPLNSIIGLTELISDDSTTFPKTKDRLKIVFRNSKKLLALINNILEFSKIESGKFEVTKTDFIVSEFMNDVFLAMEPLVAEKELQLSIVFTNDKDLLVHSDRHKLEQIILNLISNAIKFTEIGGIKINIDSKDNSTLRLDVIDTGIGISDENKKLIFDEFKQVENTSTKKFQGAGLGLAICKKYIDLLGGEISVQSNDFKGSTFTITLSNVILDTLPLLEKFKYAQSNISRRQNRKKLLLIHDDDKNKITIENYFEKSEYDVIQSKPNPELIEELKDVSLDGIILNATNISDKYWEILYELNNNRYTSDIPMSLISLVSDGRKAFVLDVFDYIVGSGNVEKLKYCVDLIKLNNNSIEKVLWLGEDSKEKQHVIGQLKDIVEVVLVSEIENVSDNIEELKPDILLVDLLVGSESTLKLISYLKQTNKFPIIASLPEELDELTKQRLITACDTMVMDSSKDLEDTFRIMDRKFSLMKKLKKSISFPIERKSNNKNHEQLSSEVSVKVKNKLHVLIVDDDKDTLFTVGEIVKNIGCEISFANNGAECLTLLNSVSPDLVLLDIRMPIMDGFETIKKIRSNKEKKNIKVYAMTAQAMLDDFDIIKQSGFDDLITKPIDNSTLSFKIQQRIQQIKVV